MTAPSPHTPPSPRHLISDTPHTAALTRAVRGGPRDPAPRLRHAASPPLWNNDSDTSSATHGTSPPARHWRSSPSLYCYPHVSTLDDLRSTMESLLNDPTADATPYYDKALKLNRKPPLRKPHTMALRPTALPLRLVHALG